MIDTDTTAPVPAYFRGRLVAWIVGDRVWPHVAGGADGDGGGDAPGGDGGTDDTGGSDDAVNDATGGQGDDGGEGAKKVDLTQAQLDEMIKKASGRAAKDTEKRLADEAKKASLSEVERLQTEKAEADKRAAEVTEKANARLIAAEVKVAATAAGVKPDRVAAFLRIADTSDLTVDDDGEVDAADVKKLVTATLKDFPEFKAAAQGSGPGGNFNGDGAGKKPASLEDAIAGKLAKVS